MLVFSTELVHKTWGKKQLKSSKTPVSFPEPRGWKPRPGSEQLARHGSALSHWRLLVRLSRQKFLGQKVPLATLARQQSYWPDQAMDSHRPNL